MDHKPQKFCGGENPIQISYKNPLFKKFYKNYIGAHRLTPNP